MVLCISDQAFEEQKWKASLLNMSPEEKKAEIAKRAEQKRKAETERKEAEWQALKETTPSEWGQAFGGLLVIGLVIAGIIYIVA